MGNILSVIDNNYCIGCGLCSFLNKKIDMAINDEGFYKAKIQDILGELEIDYLSKYCPFSTEYDEDYIANKIFPNDFFKNEKIGTYMSSYVGHVVEEDYRELGSSGGFGKWIIAELFKSGLINRVIQVKQNIRSSSNELLYEYDIFENLDEIKSGSKSCYYPVEMSKVIKFIQENEGNYLITGVPCFIKAIRLLQLEDPIFNKRIKFTVGIFCGHLKSINYASMISWQLGVKPNDIKSLDFRKKGLGHKANEKGVEVQSISNSEIINNDIVQNLFGTNYGHGFFKYKACDYCDDVVNELADISIGDAWLPKYVVDKNGTSIIIVRNKIIQNLLDLAVDENRISLNQIDESEIIESQAGGFRHKREGLAYRLFLEQASNMWAPKKRVEPSRKLSKSKRKIHRTRIHVRDSSTKHFIEAQQNNDFNSFKFKLEKITRKLKRPLLFRMLGKIKRLFTDAFF